MYEIRMINLKAWEKSLLETITDLMGFGKADIRPRQGRTRQISQIEDVAYRWDAIGMAI